MFLQNEINFADEIFVLKIDRLSYVYNIRKSPFL